MTLLFRKDNINGTLIDMLFEAVTEALQEQSPRQVNDLSLNPQPNSMPCRHCPPMLVSISLAVTKTSRLVLWPVSPVMVLKYF